MRFFWVAFAVVAVANTSGRQQLATLNFLDLERAKSISSAAKAVTLADHDDDHEEEGHHEHDAPQLILAKIGVMLTLLCLTLICSLAPFYIGRKKTFHKFLRPISVFAAGAFVGLAMFHVLPEAVMQAESTLLGYRVGNTLNWYNLVYLLMFVGFLVLLIADNVIRAALPKNTPFSGCSVVEHEHEGMPTKAALVDASGGAGTEKVAFDPNVLLATLAMVIHSIFEGIVVGLMNDSLTLWIAMLVIAGHKLPVGFSLGVACLRSHISTIASTVYLCVYSVAVPVGIAIGTGVNAGTFKISAIFNGMSAGVLLYAGMESTMHEFRHNNRISQHLLSLIWFLLGAGFVFGMTMLHLNSGGHDHSLHIH